MFTTVKVTAAVVQLSISVHIYEQQWLLRRTLRSHVFVTLVRLTQVIHTSVTIKKEEVANILELRA